MNTTYDFVTVICFIFAVLTYFMFTEGGMRVLAHFMLPAAAFAIANQVGNHAGSNVPMNVLAVILIAAGIGYIYIIVRH
ncbi:MAG: XrtV sorting system accessory protein [Methylocella sp.]